MPRSDRDMIIARRALFVAAALAGVSGATSVHAQTPSCPLPRDPTAWLTTGLWFAYFFGDECRYGPCDEADDVRNLAGR